MAAKNQPKFYVVWSGRRTGIYTTWEDTAEQVSGFSGARYKSFPSRGEAEAAFAGGPPSSLRANYAGGSSKPGTPPSLSLGKLQALGVDLDGVAVDAACNGSPGDMEYRGVRIGTGEELFRSGPHADGTNNVGEFLAIIHAAALLKKRGDLHTAIYSDSAVAQGWVRRKRCGSKLQRTGRNDTIFELIERGLQWLHENHITNPIRKWETGEWGEIPADYGRK